MNAIRYAVDTRTTTPADGVTPPVAKGAGQRRYRRGLAIAALLLINGLLLAATLALSRQAQTAGLSAAAYGFWMAAGGGAILALGALIRRSPGRVPNRFRYWVISGLLSIALPQLLIFLAVGRIGAGLAGVAYALPTLTTWVLARTLGIEGHSPLRLAGALLGAAGALVLLLPAAGALPPGGTPWMALALAAPVVIAAGNIYRSVAWPAGARPVELAAGMLVAAAAMFLLMAAVFRADLAFWAVGGAALPVLAQIPVAATQFLAYFALQRLAPPVIFSLIGQIALVFGLGIGAVLLGETYTATALMAVAVMTAGLLGIVLGRPQPTG